MNITQGDVLLAIIVGWAAYFLLGPLWALPAVLLAWPIALVFWFIAAAVWPESES